MIRRSEKHLKKEWRVRRSNFLFGSTTAKTYAEPYLAPGKPVWLVGLSFARDTRRFVEGTVQQVK